MKAFSLHDIQRVLLATLVDDAPVSLPSIKAITFPLDAACTQTEIAGRDHLGQHPSHTCCACVVGRWMARAIWAMLTKQENYRNLEVAA